MGWENRPYYRESSGSSLPAPLHFLLYGSVPLFTAFGIRVRATAMLLLVLAGFLVFGFDKNLPLIFNFEGVGILAAIILLHEFGHCFAARSVGGDADEILLTPLGGLATAMSPRRPGATFVTLAGGPAVNVVICIGCAVAMALMGHPQSWNPFHPGWFDWPPDAVFHLHWVFIVSYYLLLFNLLPIYALDGGQMLHTILWPSRGWHQAMMWTCMVGMVGSLPLALYGLFEKGGFLLTIIMVQCFAQCLVRRRELIAMGPVEYESDEIDYSSSLHDPKPRRRRRQMSRRKINRLRREAAREATEAARIDAILAKVSEHGMHSLNYAERRILKKATERQRRRELEIKQQEL